MLTDHKPLVSPFNPDKKLPVYLGSSTGMGDHTHDIKYRSTDKHSNADGLSRIPAGPDPVFDNLISGSQQS